MSEDERHRRACATDNGGSTGGAGGSAGGANASPNPTSPNPTDTNPSRIRAGEIIAYRAWWVVDGGLVSLAHPFRWPPSTIIKGDVDAIIPGYCNALRAGVYSFKEFDIALSEAESWYRCRRAIFDNTSQFWVGSADGVSLIAGSVFIWGEVVEHERGYRSQFARVRSLDRQIGRVRDLDELRQQYAVGIDPELELP